MVRINDPDLRVYVYEMLRSQPFIDLIMLFTTGEMSMRIAEEDLAQLPVAIPPQAELQWIANEMRETAVKEKHHMSEAKRLRDERGRYATVILEKNEEATASTSSASDGSQEMTREDFYNVLRRIKKTPSQPDQEPR